MGDDEARENAERDRGMEEEASVGTSSLSTAGHRPAVPPLACMRRSPRPCVNQDIVDALKPLRDWRFAEYGCAHLSLQPSSASSRWLNRRFFPAAGSPEGISYATAISVIIACPYKLRSGEEARALFKVCP